MLRPVDAVRGISHRGGDIEIGDITKGILSTEHLHLIGMLLHIGIGILDDGKIAGGIRQEEVITCRLGVHTHIKLTEHRDSLLYPTCSVEDHAQGDGGEYFSFARLMLARGKTIQLEDTHSEAIFIDAIQEKIRESHQHREVRLAIGIEALLIIYEEPIDERYRLLATLRSGVHDDSRDHDAIMSAGSEMIEIEIAPHQVVARLQVASGEGTATGIIDQREVLVRGIRVHKMSGNKHFETIDAVDFKIDSLIELIINSIGHLIDATLITLEVYQRVDHSKFIVVGDHR